MIAARLLDYEPSLAGSDLAYWASGLSHVYHEGALTRALDAASRDPQ